MPKPQPPNWGAPGLLTAPKDLSTVPDQTPDVFAPGSTLRISDVYGWSAHYDVYDLGCGNSFLSDPAAVMNTNLANSNIEFEQTNLALLAGAEDIVKSDQLVNWLGDTLQTISTAITPIIFGGDGRPGWLGLGVHRGGIDHGVERAADGIPRLRPHPGGGGGGDRVDRVRLADAGVDE